MTTTTRDLLLKILKPGDKLLWRVGGDEWAIDDMKVLKVENGKIKIRFQIEGKGAFFEKEIYPELVAWDSERHAEFHARFADALEADACATGCEMPEREEAIIFHLEDAWNEFVCLDDFHPDDLAEFRSGIHRLQEKVFARQMIKAFNTKYPKRTS